MSVVCCLLLLSDQPNLQSKAHVIGRYSMRCNLHGISVHFMKMTLFLLLHCPIAREKERTREILTTKSLYETCFV